MAASPSPAKAAHNSLLYVFMNTLIASVRSDTPDFTTRQLSVFLKVYLESNIEHTVRGLAGELNISKAAITRALDRLGESDFIKRERDSKDRRSVIVRRTTAGSTYLRTLTGYLSDASKQAAKQTMAG